MISLAVVGVRETVAGLQAAVVRVGARASGGLLVGAELVRERAKANIRRRHYMSRAERETTVGVPKVAPVYVDVLVGIQPGEFVPEGRTFEFGWHSRSGKQPPIDALAAWAIRRGLAHDADAARGVGFKIARNMKAHGYAFGEMHWLRDALRDEAPAVMAAVSRFVE